MYIAQIEYHMTLNVMLKQRLLIKKNWIYLVILKKNGRISK